MRILLPCLLSLTLAGCSSESAVISDPGPQASTATLLIEHTIRGKRLDADVTALRVTGMSRDGREVVAPPQTFGRADQIRVPLPVRSRGVRIEYLSGSTVVGEGQHNLLLKARETATLSNPFYERTPLPPRLDDSELDFGGVQEATGSPLPLISPSPGSAGLNLTAFIGNGRPLALLPQHLSYSALFGANVTLPPRVILPMFPPVGQQGSGLNTTGYPGTCVAWSFGYGLGSYTAALNPNFSVNATLSNSTSNSNLASPMYLYEMAIEVLGVNATSKLKSNGNVTYCAGSTDVYLPFMVGNGAATTSTLEYTPSCPDLLSGANVVATIPPNAGLQIGSYATNLAPKSVNTTTTPPSVSQLRQFLANGQPIAFTTQIWNNFVALPTTNGVFYGSGCSQGGHGMLIVGYDDTLGAPGHEGAFLVQNSFGTAWPDPGNYPTPSPCPSAVPSPDASPQVLASPGQFYLAYSAFNSTTTGSAVAYPVDPTVPTTGNLTGSAGSPAGAINGTYQVTVGNTTILVLNHWFAQPLLLGNLTLTDPSGVQAVNPLSFPLRNGYTHVRRSDGKSFQNGTYAVSLTATTGAGTPVSYTGNVTLGPVSPGFPTLPPASFPARLIGTDGNPITTTGTIGRRP